jgi:hypothetical protein
MSGSQDELQGIIENIETLKKQRANSKDRKTSSQLKKLTDEIIEMLTRGPDVRQF